MMTALPGCTHRNTRSFQAILLLVTLLVCSRAFALDRGEMKQPRCKYEGCKRVAAPGKPYCPGHKPIAFIERYCSHVKGKWAGSRFTLIPWQRKVLFEAFGQVDRNGNRIVRFIYIEIPKKNGKSELASGLALFGLCGDGEPGAEVYSAAGDREQASLVYQPASVMVQNNATLNNRLKVVDSRKRIVDYKTNSFYQVLSSEHHTKHGLNPSFIIADETHSYPDRTLWDVLTDETDVARAQQLVFVITTAGVKDRNSIGWELHEYARQVKEGIIDDPSWYPVIFAADQKEDDWKDPKVWKKANPALGHIFDMARLKRNFKSVENNPARINNWQRFRLNLWVGQTTRYIPMDYWDLGADPIDEAELMGRTCYGGLDLSSKHDLTSFVVLFPPRVETEAWKVVPHFFMADHQMKEREYRDKVPFAMWTRAGLVHKTPGNIIDYSFIRQVVNQEAKRFNLRLVAHDPWGSIQLAIQLAEEDGIEMVEMRQGYKSMSEPTKELHSLILAERFQHGGHKVLTWCADNMVVTMDAAENVKPVKDKAKDRIDGIVATINAFGAALADLDGRSRYEDEGEEVVTI